MHEQVFSISVVYDYKTNLITDDVRDWVSNALEGKVDRYVGLVGELFGSMSYGRTIQFVLKVIHKSEITVEELSEYLSNPPEIFRIENIVKR